MSRRPSPTRPSPTRPVPRRTHANARPVASAPRSGRGMLGGLSDDDRAYYLTEWAKTIPRGRTIYGIERDASRRSASLYLSFVFVDRKTGAIQRVPPNAGVLAGFDFDRDRDAFNMSGKSDPVAEFAAKLGLLLHRSAKAFKARDSFL